MSYDKENLEKVRELAGKIRVAGEEVKGLLDEIGAKVKEIRGIPGAFALFSVYKDSTKRNYDASGDYLLVNTENFQIEVDAYLEVREKV